MIAYETQAAREDPARFMFFLHGILGTRANWRSFARKWTAARPDWGAVLVDLRVHGDSRGEAPPHTVEAAARDLEAIPIRPSAILGHSFGGKVALEYARANAPELTIVVDSTPGARPELVGTDYGAYAIARVLERAPARVSKRADYMDWMIAEGLDRETAQWLAMNVRREGDAFEMGFDLDAIRALLDDYFRRDLWEVVESPRGRVEIVIGTRGSVPEEDRERMRRSPSKVREVDAGHWVHVEAPDALLEIVSSLTG